MRVLSHGARVVLIPGVLGSELLDGSLTPPQARQQCERNLGLLGRVLQNSALYPCDKRPDTLWGSAGSLHWIFNPEAWGARMRSGNGYDLPGQVRVGGLVDIDLRLGRRRVAVQPYASLFRALQGSGADVMVFPYDWRLSLTHNAITLQQEILQRWFKGAQNRDVGTVAEEDRITFIGHSMGGLLARYFVESPRRNGWLVLRQLITIGTPHLGAPEAFLHLTGRTLPFPENPFYRAGREAALLQLTQKGMAHPGELRAQFLPAKVQTQVVRHTASGIEPSPGLRLRSQRRPARAVRHYVSRPVPPRNGTFSDAANRVATQRGRGVPARGARTVAQRAFGPSLPLPCRDGIPDGGGVREARGPHYHEGSGRRTCAPDQRPASCY